MPLQSVRPLKMREFFLKLHENKDIRKEIGKQKKSTYQLSGISNTLLSSRPAQLYSLSIFIARIGTI